MKPSSSGFAKVMTTSYANDISDGQGVMVFAKILIRWRGSLYKLIWIDLAFYVALYYVLNLVYRFALNEQGKRNFEMVVKFADNMKGNVPLSFLLGFFVAGVIGRWWQMYMTIPWLNRIAFLMQVCAAHKIQYTSKEGVVIGQGEENARKIRVTLLRYMNLAWIILMRKISDQIAIRFREAREEEAEEEGEGEASGTKKDQEEVFVRDIFVNFNCDKKVKSTFRKLITDSEMRAFDVIAAEHYKKYKTRYDPEYWIPMQWAVRLTQKAFIHGYICDPRTMTMIIDEIDVLRGQMQTLQIFSSIMIPLVYTQVVIIAVYSYFLCQVFASQFVDPKQNIKGREVDFYIPVFTIFQFMFLMGWLKVAMCVMNPFGDDDEDFQTSEILDYNLDISYRSAQASQSLYPENLTPAAFQFKAQPGSEEDKLEDFIEDVDTDMNDIVPPDELQDMSGLEIRPSRWEIIRDYFSHRCERRRRRARPRVSQNANGQYRRGAVGDDSAQLNMEDLTRLNSIANIL